MSTYEQQRAYVQQTQALAAEYRRLLGPPDPFIQDVKTAVWTAVAPRLAMDETMPDLSAALRDVDGADALRRRRHVVADRIRGIMSGRRFGRDETLDDLENLLEALAERHDHGGEDRHHRYGRDDDEPVDRPGFEPATDPAENPWGEAEDAELEELKGQMSPEAYDRLRRAASDRRRRDAEDRRRGRSPAEDFGRRLRGRDSGPPPFPGMPIPGSSMTAMNSSVDRPGMSHPEPVDARDRRPSRFDGRPRRFGEDAMPHSFSNRFKFTQNATPEAASRIPGAPSSTY
jgi:hypothetical protein